MADDLELKFTKISDESRYVIGNEVVREKVYVFYLGKYGPFTERVPLEPFDEYEIQRRVDKLRPHVMSPAR